ncbi:hypothetical protein EYR38_004721 [Pleurotus pulmonarius]|nr:hypothetical protein EYR38_004721 [Pleurotus pulmonarius]
MLIFLTRLGKIAKLLENLWRMSSRSSQNCTSYVMIGKAVLVTLIMTRVPKSKHKYFVFEIVSLPFIAALMQVLDYASPNGVEYQFLHYQVQKTVCLLERISASYTFPSEELRGAESLGYKLTDDEIPLQARVSLLRSTTIEVLQTLQLLENQPYNLSLWEGAQHLMQLGNDLNDLELKDDAAAVVIWSTAIYQTLMQRNPITYLPYVAWGLAQLAAIRNGTPEGLHTVKRGVDLCREMAAISQVDCSSYLAKSLCLYADHLITNGRFEEALIHSREALAIQRKAPASQEGLDSIPVCWEAPGEECVSLSSARSFSRPYQTAVEDGVCLAVYAKSLGLVDQFSEALIVATEAIACLEALTKYDPQTQAFEVWLSIMREDRENLIMSICTPSPPLVASISAVDEESGPGA